MLYDSEAAHKGTYHLKTKEPIVEDLMNVLWKKSVWAQMREMCCRSNFG